MKVVACLAVQGRGPLVKHTIARLLNVNKVDKVICAVSDHHDALICEQSGAQVVIEKNNPLGRKWNAAFLAAKDHQPDAVLFVGSSDWISEDWLRIYTSMLPSNGMIGSPGCHFVDYHPTTSTRLVYWSGYANGLPHGKRAKERENEPIGIGRIISKDALDLMQWMPFNNEQDNSLDWTMYQKIIANKGEVICVRTAADAVSISCHAWANKHKFEEHWSNRLPSQRIKDLKHFHQSFPEWEQFIQSI
jgi:hypothetical protein